MDHTEPFGVPGLPAAPFSGAAFAASTAPRDSLHLDLRGLLALLDADDSAERGNALFRIQRVTRNTELVYEGGRADWLYVVLCGAFKSVKTAEDGYEHVLGFAWRRDLIGYDGLCAARRYAFSVLALEDSRVVAIHLDELAALRRGSAALDQALQRRVALQLAHSAQLAEVMAATSAEVRLVRFLLQMGERMEANGESGRRLQLRMGRRDIANHLGLAHETVSRCFQLLNDAGWLRVLNRDITILDAPSLQQRARHARPARGGLAAASEARAGCLPRVH